MPGFAERWSSAVAHWSGVLHSSHSRMGAIERDQMRRFLKRWSGRRGVSGQSLKMLQTVKSWWTDTLWTRTNKFYSFERAYFEKALDQLGSASRARLAEQLKQVNKIQRICQGTEVGLYRMQRGRVTFDESIRIAGLPPECRFFSTSVSRG